MWLVAICVPLKYPFSSVSCIVLSMRCGAGSCVEGRGIRSCHFGSGRFCCRRGRRVYPDSCYGLAIVLSSLLAIPLTISFPCSTAFDNVYWRMGASYLSRIDLLTGESVFVSPHDVALVSFAVSVVRLLCLCLSSEIFPRHSRSSIQ